MSRHPAAVTSGGDGLGTISYAGTGSATLLGSAPRADSLSAVSSAVRSAVSSAESVGEQIVSSGKKIARSSQQIVPKIPKNMIVPKVPMPFASSRAAQEAAARRNFAASLAEDCHAAVPFMHSENEDIGAHHTEWVHIDVAPAPSPPVEDTSDIGATRDWKIIFDVYRDEFKRKEVAMLSSAGQQQTKVLRPALRTIQSRAQKSAELAAARQEEGGTHDEIKQVHRAVMAKLRAADEALQIYASAFQSVSESPGG